MPPERTTTTKMDWKLHVVLLALVSLSLVFFITVTFALPQELLRDNARSNRNNGGEYTDGRPQLPPGWQRKRPGPPDSGGGDTTASARIRVEPGVDSAALECNIAGLERRYAAERARAQSQAGNDDGERASLQRLIQWYRVPPGDQSGLAQQVRPDDDFNFIITPKYTSATNLLPSKSLLSIYNINERAGKKYTGMYWCNYTDDSGQNVMQVFTVELGEQHAQPTNVYNSYPTDHQHPSRDEHDHDHDHQDDHEDDHEDAAGGGVREGEFYCYHCIPSALNQYCTQVDAHTARVACPRSRRCLSMSAQCEGIAQALPFAVCDPIEYEGWTETVLREPLVLENGKCAVVSDEMEASILQDVAREPFNHIQNAIRSSSAANNMNEAVQQNVDMHTYHYDTCRLQQITLCRCDSPGCNIKPEFLIMTNATNSSGNKDQRLMDAQASGSNNNFQNAPRANNNYQNARQQPNSAPSALHATTIISSSISVLAMLLLLL